MAAKPAGGGTQGGGGTSLATSLLQVSLAGASNATAASVTNPVDVVKVRMQMAGEGVSSGGVASAGRRGGVWQAARALMREEGPSGFYRGIGASLCREMSYSGIRMGLYEPTKQALGATDPARTSLALKIGAGAITGATGSVLANPFDLVKVRMQSAPGSGGRSCYSSVFTAISTIYSEGEGLRGLWRGTGATVKRATLLTASQVPSYDHVKHTLVDGGYLREGYPCHFFCSMVAGVIAAAVTSPADLVKSRLMVQPIDPATGRGTLYSGLGDCFMKVVRTEGVPALFKGFHTQWLRIGPHTTVSLMVFEEMRRLAGMRYL